MSDYASARAAGIAAVDELDLWQGQPTLSSELASVTALQAQVASDATTITNMKAAASASVARDAANVEGQAVLDAATAGGH